MARKIQRVILLIDNSGSMNGNPIEKIKLAVKKLSDTIDYYNSLSSRIEFQIITFSNSAKFVSRNRICNIEAQGKTNLADAYKKLNLIFKKHSTFDYKPIILLLCDGQPNLGNHKLALDKLNQNNAFNESLKIAFAYGIQDLSTIQVLKDFAGSHENVIQHDRISTVKYVIEHSLPKVLKEQAKRDNKKYGDLLKIIRNDVKLRTAYGFKRNI